MNFIEKLLSEVSRPNMCFAEQDGAEDTGGGSGGDEQAPGDEQVDNDDAPLKVDDEQTEPGDEDSGDSEPSADDEEEEGEYFGRKASLPKWVAEGIKNGTLTHADYTQKTQALADERRAHDARVKDDKADIENRRAVAKDSHRLETIDEQIKAIKEHHSKIDWQKWRTDNPNAASAAKEELRDLVDEANDLRRSIDDRVKETQSKARVAEAEQYKAANTEIKKHIPNWGQEKALELMKFAVNEFGADPQEVAILGKSPALVRMINAAAVAHKAKKAALVPIKGGKVKDKDEAQVKPVTRVAARGNVSSEPSDKDDAKTWLKKRYGQLKNNPNGHLIRARQ